MAGYWARFAATGDPNGPDLPRWPSNDPGTNQVLELGRELRVIGMPRMDRYDVFVRVLEKKLAQRATDFPRR